MSTRSPRLQERRRSSSTRASPEPRKDWDRYMPTILAKYRGDDNGHGMKLAEIRKYMIEVHDFTASVDQYKKKLAGQKNVPGAVLDAISYRLEERRQQNPSVNYTAKYKDKFVSEKKLKRRQRERANRGERLRAPSPESEQYIRIYPSNGSPVSTDTEGGSTTSSQDAPGIPDYELTTSYSTYPHGVPWPAVSGPDFSTNVGGIGGVFDGYGHGHYTHSPVPSPNELLNDPIAALSPPYPTSDHSFQHLSPSPQLLPVSYASYSNLQQARPIEICHRCNLRMLPDTFSGGGAIELCRCHSSQAQLA
ncbi:hypothetical protein BJ508DRAFT_412632 [Ascobolus immersus RN42]|uniref:Clr5 domain-containing protein n=1 Tax=Ascobolus immersus RN42 TaxID=1160509 RepID=A0A3N4IFH3_ASCIM|nr:hypothetical protein BJ508DRAFT_412632 [Ascobolus immersus RN42]